MKGARQTAEQRIEHSQHVLNCEMRVRAFERGFAIGADLRKSASRHVVEAETHDHWRAGFEAGRAAAVVAA